MAYGAALLTLAYELVLVGLNLAQGIYLLSVGALLSNQGETTYIVLILVALVLGPLGAAVLVYGLASREEAREAQGESAPEPAG